MLLTRLDWDQIQRPPLSSLVPEHFIFVYLLGESKSLRSLAKEIASTLGLKIIFIPHIHFSYNKFDVNFADVELNDVGPEDFLGLIKAADFIVTDSFHGCIFSIIFHKNFVVLKRTSDSIKTNMNSRIYSLLEPLNLMNRLLIDTAPERLQILTEKIDYNKVDNRLQELREFSISRLMEAIKN